MNTTAPKIISGKVEIIQDVVYDICNNNYKDVCLLANTFINTTQSNINILESLLSKKDFKSLRFAAHACRSSLSIFSFPLLYRNLTEIEHLTKTNFDDVQLTIKLKSAIELYKSMLALMIATYK